MFMFFILFPRQSYCTLNHFHFFFLLSLLFLFRYLLVSLHTSLNIRFYFYILNFCSFLSFPFPRLSYTVPISFWMHIQNVPRQNVLKQNIPGTKHPRDKTSQGQNVPRTKRPKDKTSQGTKRPKGQNILLLWGQEIPVLYVLFILV